ncbi:MULTISPECIES: stage III sporulation protein AH [Oceanobacillus]|uniref:stage III sporulation protein AH n=1 Tax=Oceanobacillus TaxID=182709 RepID=UPI0021A8262E|nr:stage III sporulation protein AH [Oceanobacillus sojae]MCT1905452.1 stage III sporulation protein AH [Oceanobacillus sojae]
MIVLQKDAKGTTYQDLIDVCFDICDQFHLVLRKDMGPLKSFDTFLKTIDSALITMKEESEWASTILGDGQTAKVYYYHTKDEKVKRIIKEKVTSLYEWEMPEHPEDLSFFKNGEVWLATTSHEEECYIFPGSEEETNRIMNIKGIAAAIEEDE